MTKPKTLDQLQAEKEQAETQLAQEQQDVYKRQQYTKVPCGTLCKTQHRINEDVVLSLVSEMLKAIAEYAKHDRAEFVRVVQEAQSSQQTAEVRKQRTRLATAKQRAVSYTHLDVYKRQRRDFI